MMDFSHDVYRLAGLDSNYLTHNTLSAFLEKLQTDERFQVVEEGRSTLDRPLFSIRFGKGRQKLFIWSQMHGNEATATRAILDFLNALKHDTFLPFWEQVLNKVEVVIVPMVNPDGAEAYTRANALHIDLNRDAVSPICPESALLKELILREKPDVGVNMHDQRNLFNVKGTPNPATIAFLSPSFNEAKDVNKQREEGMRIISCLEDTCNQHIPGHVARFDDSFYPRSFGDNVQKWGFNNILIESGAYPNDPNREVARRVNYYLLIELTHILATNKHEEYSLRSYHNIPENDTKLFDILVKAGKIEFKGKTYTVDLGLRYKEVLQEGQLVKVWNVAEIGDLTGFYGHLTLEGELTVTTPNNASLQPNNPVTCTIVKDGTNVFTFENGLQRYE